MLTTIQVQLSILGIYLRQFQLSSQDGAATMRPSSYTSSPLIDKPNIVQASVALGVACADSLEYGAIAVSVNTQRACQSVPRVTSPSGYDHCAPNATDRQAEFIDTCENQRSFLLRPACRVGMCEEAMKIEACRVLYRSTCRADPDDVRALPFLASCEIYMAACCLTQAFSTIDIARYCNTCLGPYDQFFRAPCL